MVAVTVMDEESEVQCPTGAEEQGRVFGGDPWPVGGEEEIGGEFGLVSGGEGFEPQGPGLLGCLHEDLHVLAKLTGTGTGVCGGTRTSTLAEGFENGLQG